MREDISQIFGVTSELNSKNKIRLLDGRIIEIPFDKRFSIKGDTGTHKWDLSWLSSNYAWSDLVINNLLQLLRTHSLIYSYQTARIAKILFNRPLFHKKNQLDLDSIAKVPELIPMSYWINLQPLLKKMADQDELGVISEDLKNFLVQPSKWETKRKGAYFALVTNDPKHGAFTEQELFSIQEGVNLSVETHRINLEEYALVWFLIGTGVRPVQIARMKAGDVKVYDGPEGKEVTLYIPLAKGEGSSNQGKWRRRCPTVLAEILIEYIKHYKLNSDQPIFEDQAVKVSSKLKKIFQKVDTYSERTDTNIHMFPYRFRYTLATRAIALGASDAEVSRLLTHRSTTCVQSYRAAMPELQEPIKDAIFSEMNLIASAFQGRVIKDLNDATRKGRVDSLIRDYINLSGETIGACGTEADCHQHVPRACLVCRKFEPFRDAPWGELLTELRSEMDEEEDDKMKLITLPYIETIKIIQKKCEDMKDD